MTLLCLTHRCAIPGRHRDGCDDACRGCLPGYAADGLRLCGHHTERIGADAVKAATLHAELELMLRPSGLGGRSGKPGSASPPRDEVVAMRTEIRHVLVAWCKLVAEQRGLQLPADNVNNMGEFVNCHREWLAATEYADECSDELASLASRAWGLAYPSGTRRVEVGPCPKCGGVKSGRWIVEQLPAGFIGPPRRAGRLTAVIPPDEIRPQDRRPTWVLCDLDDAHAWDSTQFSTLDRLVLAKKRSVAV